MTAGGVFLPLPWTCKRFFHQIETSSPTAIYSDEWDKERYFPHSCSGLLSLQSALRFNINNTAVIQRNCPEGC